MVNASSMGRVPVQVSGADSGLALRIEAAEVPRATTRCRAEQVRRWYIAVGAQAPPPPAGRVAAKMTGLGWLRRQESGTDKSLWPSASACCQMLQSHLCRRRRCSWSGSYCALVLSSPACAGPQRLQVPTTSPALARRFTLSARTTASVSAPSMIPRCRVSPATSVKRAQAVSAARLALPRTRHDFRLRAGRLARSRWTWPPSPIEKKCIPPAHPSSLSAPTSIACSTKRAIRWSTSRSAISWWKGPPRMPSRRYPLCRGGQDDSAATPIDRVSTDGAHVRCSIDGPPPGAVPSSPSGYQAVSQWHVGCGDQFFWRHCKFLRPVRQRAGRLVLLA